MTERTFSGLLKKHKSLMLYGLIGLTGATLDFVAYLFLISVLGIPPPIASFLSVSIGITNNFFLNLKHNFKVEGGIFLRFISFYATGVVGAIISAILIYILHDLAGLDAVIAKIITIPPIVLGQFFINKKISFSDKPLKISGQIVKKIRRRSR